jgi:hypothetical protein
MVLPRSDMPKPLAVRTVTWLRDEEARPVQRTLDHTWTKLAYDPRLPCTGQGFLAASGAVSPAAPGPDGEGRARHARAEP